jgi:hypothetical protein
MFIRDQPLCVCWSRLTDESFAEPSAIN